MSERVTVTEEAILAACMANLHPDAVPSETERRKMRAALEAALPLIVAEERDKSDRLCDSNYVAGMRTGWNFAVNDDKAGYEAVVEGRVRDRADKGAPDD